MLEEMGTELSGAFVSGHPTQPSRTRTGTGNGDGNDQPKEPKAKKVRTAVQEAQSAIWKHECVCMESTQGNNTANKYLTESQMLLNELNVAPETTVFLGLTATSFYWSFAQECTLQAGSHHGYAGLDRLCDASQGHISPKHGQQDRGERGA